MRFYQVNQYIKADKVRVIGPDGEQVGILEKDEALFKARQLGVDLVEVAPSAKPPVCKLIDFNKFKYQQKKKEKAGRSKKTQETKEIWFSPFISDNDKQVRVEKAKEFLEEGDRVKLTVRFKGRQMRKKEFGQELIDELLKLLEEHGTRTKPAKWHGRSLSVSLKPAK